MRRVTGFTLVELVMVIVVLSIVSLISVRFVQLSMVGAIDTANRQRLGMAAGVISEQLSRELRAALPGSVRTGQGGQCIEFFPIHAGSTYIDGDDSFEPKEGLDAFKARPFSRSVGDAKHVVIYPYGETALPGDLYDASKTRVGLDEVTDLMGSDEGLVEIALSSTHSFPERSPRRRVMLVTDPVTFCQDGRFLFRYSNYGIESNVDRRTSGDRGVVGAPLDTSSGSNPLEFIFQSPTQQRNGVVTFEFSLRSSASNETLDVAQEVQVRNVP